VSFLPQGLRPSRCTFRGVTFSSRAGLAYEKHYLRLYSIVFLNHKHRDKFIIHMDYVIFWDNKLHV
jgi:hypothetical protein